MKAWLTDRADDGEIVIRGPVPDGLEPGDTVIVLEKDADVTYEREMVPCTRRTVKRLTLVARFEGESFTAAACAIALGLFGLRHEADFIVATCETVEPARFWHSLRDPIAATCIVILRPPGEVVWRYVSREEMRALRRSTSRLVEAAPCATHNVS